MIYLIAILGLLLLICLFPRQMLVIVAVVVLFLSLIAGYWYLEDRAEKQAQNAVIIGVRYIASGDCDRDCPLRVSIVNQSSRVVERAEWQFVACRSGHSSDLVEGYNPVHSDRILQPGESVALCFRLPSVSGDTVPAQLQWSVKYQWVKFRD